MLKSSITSFARFSSFPWRQKMTILCHSHDIFLKFNIQKKIFVSLICYIYILFSCYAHVIGRKHLPPQPCSGQTLSFTLWHGACAMRHTSEVPGIYADLPAPVLGHGRMRQRPSSICRLLASMHANILRNVLFLRGRPRGTASTSLARRGRTR